MEVIEILDILGKKANELDTVDGDIPGSYIGLVSDPITGKLYNVTKAQLQKFAGSVIAGSDITTIVKQWLTDNNVALASKTNNITSFKRTGNTVYDVVDQYTGQYVSLNKATSKVGGGSITDGDVDNIIYFKLGSEYFKRNFSQLQVEWFGATGNGTTNDRVALQKAFDAGYALRNTITLPPLKYNCGYTTPLVIKGDTTLIQGSGAATNSTDRGTIIFGMVQIGDTTTDTTRGVMRDISIMGPGWQDQTNRTLHAGTGILAVKGLEFQFRNVSVEGFKYGFDVYPDPTVSILQVNTILIDGCRFYNNKICGIAAGRGAHALTITNNTNISYNNYCIVIGVFDKTTDTIQFDNAEPIITVNITNGNTMQGWFKSGIVITSSKKVTIENNYFELGNTYADQDEAILLGSSTAASLVYLGMEDNVMAPIINGNSFQLNTRVFTYKSNTCCIRVRRAKKGSITNNLLTNIAYPILENDEQLRGIYLVKDDEAVFDGEITYHGNMITFGREKTEEYVIVDEGYSSVHGSYAFSFLNNRPPFLQLEDNRFKYNGTFYSLSYLGGGTDGNPNDQGAIFGAVAADIVKFPQVLNNNTTIIA